MNRVRARTDHIALSRRLIYTHFIIITHYPTNHQRVLDDICKNTEMDSTKPSRSIDVWSDNTYLKASPTKNLQHTLLVVKQALDLESSTCALLCY